ncbi:hypothetical protein TH9_08435 [Thalassospira xiamenensis]|nr:hypothetical protein TH9_08435 [Thalassospira xiamenensis]
MVRPMNKYMKLLFGGTFVLLQACGIQHTPERILEEDDVARIREIGINYLEKEAQDPTYLPPGYAKLGREEVEAALVDKAFTFVNPLSGWQFRAELTAENKVLIRGRGARSWSGEAYWEPFSAGDYQDRDKLCLTSTFCFVFSRFDDLEGNDMLGARVHPKGQGMLAINHRYWVFTHIDPINGPAK